MISSVFLVRANQKTKIFLGKYCSDYLTGKINFIPHIIKSRRAECERTRLSNGSLHPTIADSIGDAMTKMLSGKERHHLAAADHHELAARHRREASKYYEESDHAHAAHQAPIA